MLLLLVACDFVPLDPGVYDRDGDGFQAVELGGDDCDDSDPQVHPNATEICGDDIDNNCDQAVDDVGVGESEWFLDLDGDGYGAGDGQLACPNAVLPGWTLQSGDCDDEDNGTHPGVVDAACDGVDNDCNGLVDDSEVVTLFLDEDGDGVGSVQVEDCEEVPDTVAVVTESGDCDDTDPLTFPGALDVCDGEDNDCSGVPDDDGVATADGVTNHSTVGEALRNASTSVSVCSGTFKVSTTTLSGLDELEVHGQGVSETALLPTADRIFRVTGDASLDLQDITVGGAGTAVQVTDAGSVHMERVRVSSNERGILLQGDPHRASPPLATLVDVEILNNSTYGVSVDQRGLWMDGGLVDGNSVGVQLALNATVEANDVDWGASSAPDITGPSAPFQKPIRVHIDGAASFVSCSSLKLPTSCTVIP